MTRVTLCRFQGPLGEGAQIPPEILLQRDLHNRFTLYILRPEIEQIRRLLGSRPNPSRSCRDPWLAHPDSSDGWHWVDPNWGVPDDAVRVFCGMRAGGETCVFVDGDTDSARLSSNASSWFSSLKGGFRLRNRTVGDVQLRFLSLLSTGEYRNFTFVCNNVNAWYSQRTKDHARALRFRGRNDAQMSFGKDSCRVPVNDCQTIAVVSLIPALRSVAQNVSANRRSENLSDI
ncbi:collagen alpha-1(V) chain-like [Amblyomma americanum]